MPGAHAHGGRTGKLAPSATSEMSRFPWFAPGFWIGVTKNSAVNLQEVEARQSPIVGVAPIVLLDSSKIGPGGPVATAPGHKSSQHLVEAEAYRRILRGEAPATLDAFARQLLQWLNNTYPAAAAATPHAVENWVRDTWHRRRELSHGG